ncbi:capsule biosynthesis protein [Saccharibacter sp. 17.LH.SD]|uniref:capsule biosynthesis protein n=1 Tax=Saccharibacter sp. 17.LH.SD TaxID=2689393 RepID=UPI00136AC44A|nr:capsule biosynthesis protein [Saccharibacter sp. 17.LH.SD]MXV45175.1 capsule biosynthesis protein [Saccharibacter sp. 17.LH.SD]
MNQVPVNDTPFEGQISFARSTVSSVVAWGRRNLGLCIGVFVPTLLSAAYYAFLATPQYVSEAEFVVRGQHARPSPILTGLLEGGGGAATEDTYVVQAYVTSRDAAQLLMRTQNLKKVYNTPVADALARFPNFYSGHTFEHFYRYYKKHITAELDTNTGVSILRVRTFNPSDSQRVARALLRSAENLVNDMNTRQRANTIAASSRELQSALNKLAAVNQKIDAYRNEIAMLDPTKQSQPILKDIASLQTMLVTTRVELAQLQRSTPHSPLIEVHKRRITALEIEIKKAEEKITGSDMSFVPKVSGYDDLIFQRTLLEKEVIAADSALATAKLQADRQLLYLDEVTQPNLPDYATYPHAISDIAVVFAATFSMYLMIVLLIGGAREHKLT